MKLKIVAVVVTGLLAANVAHAAEVYNKDGNKLDPVSYTHLDVDKRQMALKWSVRWSARARS